MRILSLLPSATEIVYALGLDDMLVGVTHECDWPPQVRAKPVVSHSALPPAATAAEIDRLVIESIGSGNPIYRLDTEAIRRLRPDIVLTQDLCAVCAVPSGHVTEALEVIGCSAEVVSLDPTSLDEVLDCVAQVGKATGAETRADSVVVDLRRRLDRVSDAVRGLARPRTFALEWADPPFSGGHWVPEMLERAGGESVLGSPGLPSVRLGWAEIDAAAPEVVVFMPCGYGLDAATAEAEPLCTRAEFASVSAFFAVHADAYFSRPGPRLVDGVELLAAALHPDHVDAPPAGRMARLR